MELATQAMAPRDTSVELTLLIWRDFVPQRPLAFIPDKDARQVFDDSATLQEQIYSWPLREDAFGGIADDKTRRSLEVLLVERLADSRHPSERQPEALREFIDASQAAIDDGQVTPVQCVSRGSEGVETEEHDQIEVNALLALIIHLKWIVACFDKRPGISVSVR